MFLLTPTLVGTLQIPNQAPTWGGIASTGHSTKLPISTSKLNNNQSKLNNNKPCPSSSSTHQNQTPNAPSSSSSSCVGKEEEEEEEDEEEDEEYMKEALGEAQRASSMGEVPVGAVLVANGTVLARAHNRVEADADPTAHAEMLCIRSAACKLQNWRLTDSTLYVTLEPCPMCAGALLQARVGRVVWGAKNKLLGANGSWVSILPRPVSNGNEEEMIDANYNSDSEDILSRKAGNYCESDLRHPFHTDLVVRSGVLAKECSEVMKAFFRRRRREVSNKTT